MTKPEFPTRRIGDLEVSALGLGCMGMSFAYGTADRTESLATLNGALDSGVNFLDTADMYGNGHNERLVAEVLANRRDEVVVATKFGISVVGELPQLWIPPSNSSVTTIVGWWHTAGPVRVIDEAEVATVLRVPLQHLLDPANRFTVRLSGGWKGPAFDVGDGLVLWGFTAGIVSRLFAHVGWERTWDHARVRPRPTPGRASMDSGG